MHVIITCNFEKDQMKNSQEKLATPFPPIITLWELSAMETRVLIRSGPKPYATFPLPNDASYMKVWTDGRTDGNQLDSHPIIASCESSAQQRRHERIRPTGFPTRADTHRAVQTQKMTSGSKLTRCVLPM